IAAPLREDSYCYGVQKFGDTALNKVLELYKLETVTVERRRLRHALRCYQNITGLKSILKSTLDGNVFPLEDVGYVFHIIAENPIAGELVFLFLFENWEYIYKRLHDNFRLMTRVISACLSTSSTHSQLR
ncbi:hypothetical protein OSTOST_02874, partial [Ostertagia ostertagi]